VDGPVGHATMQEGGWASWACYHAGRWMSRLGMLPCRKVDELVGHATMQEGG